MKKNDTTYFAIRTEEEYVEALSKVQQVLSLNPPLDSVDGRLLETLILHVKEYESQHYQILAPGPIEAIEFVMEQQGLKQRDLEPFIGSKSRVSEILSGKRTLTLAMAQKLHKGLNIPAEILLAQNLTDTSSVDWERFPIKELIRRGWIKVQDTTTSNYQAVLEEFLSPLGSDLTPAILYRKTENIRAKRDLDEYSMLAWIARVVRRANEEFGQLKYEPGSLKKQHLIQIAKLSIKPDGPRLACDYLQEFGIRLVVEKHLKHTKLDAAIILRHGNAPVIGMTLRHDRIDNFWFSLMHELGHLLLHATDDSFTFADNFDVRYTEDPREIEADKFARDALIPENAWRNSVAYSIPSPSAAKLLARELGVHVAIVAGRIRHELNSYQVLSNLVGSGEVRLHFPEVTWS